MTIHLRERNSEKTFTAELHGLPYQPPASIRDSIAEARIVKLNGRPTPFYFGETSRGERRGESRVNFELGGIWFHITGAPGTPNNLFLDLRDWNQSFDFTTTGEPINP